MPLSPEKALPKPAYATTRGAFRVLVISAVATAGVLTFFGGARLVTWQMSGQTDANAMVEQWRAECCAVAPRLTESATALYRSWVE